MVKVTFFGSGVVALMLAGLAVVGGATFYEGIVGGAILFVFFVLFGLLICGLVSAFKAYGKYISTGMIAAFLLFWKSILPAVCIKAICHSLGFEN